MDNIFTERLWHSVKYEEMYINDCETVHDAKEGINRYIKFYDQERAHQSLSYRTSAEVYFGSNDKTERTWRYLKQDKLLSNDGVHFTLNIYQWILVPQDPLSWRLFYEG